MYTVSLPMKTYTLIQIMDQMLKYYFISKVSEILVPEQNFEVRSLNPDAYNLIYTVIYNMYSEQYSKKLDKSNQFF